MHGCLVSALAIRANLEQITTHWRSRIANVTLDRTNGNKSAMTVLQRCQSH